MTLQKFSDKSFSSMFKTRLKSAVFFPIVGMIILAFFVVGYPFSEVVHLNNPAQYGYMDYVSIENVRYILFGDVSPYYGDFPSYSVLMYMTVIIAAILCAIMVFKDLSNKKTANVYYSLGFSRSSLFASTYLAGAVSILGMILVPFSLSFIINSFAFGISKQLISACIFTVSCLCNVSLIAYTLSTIAMSLSGMFVEGAFFSFFLNAVSPIFAFSSCMFSDGLLTGGGFVEANSYYYATFENSFVSAFLGKISFLNALSHSATEVERLGCCLYTSDIDGIRDYLSVENWTTPSFVPLLVWSFVLAGIIALSVFVFNRKKAENIGFFASSPILYRLFFGTLIVGFSSLGCMSGRTITKGLTWLYILIILAICLAVTAILTLILTKLSRMKFKKEFRAFGIYSLAVVLFSLVFSTGFFGYQNRLPAVEKVASVMITGFSPAYDEGYYYSTEIYGVDYEAADPITMGAFDYYGDFTFTSKADITNIQELQKGLIEADNIKLSQTYRETKIGVKINVVYTLKNGKTISRSYYKITPELIDKYITYKGVSEEIKLGLIDDVNYMISSVNDNDDYYSDYVFEEFFTVFSNDFTTAHKVDLTSVQLYGLLSAYTMDVENLTAKQLLAPDEKSLGAIAIREDWNVLGSYDESTDSETIKGKGSELEYGTFNSYNHDPYNGDGYIVINENMVNTVKWAKEVGIYKYFANDYETKIGSIEVTHNNSSAIKLSFATENNYNLLFHAKSFRYNDTYSVIYFGTRLVGSHYVTGLTEDEIRYLRENAYPRYLTTETGYFIRFATNEAEPLYSTVFIPDSKLTTELKAKLAVTNETDLDYKDDVTSVGVEQQIQHVGVTTHYMPAE